MDFNTLFQELSQKDYSNDTKGFYFERYCKGFFKRYYEDCEIYLWHEWVTHHNIKKAHGTVQDIGIDIVIEHPDDGLYYVQAKFRSDRDKPLEKKDVDSFLTTSSIEYKANHRCTKLVIITTTYDVSKPLRTYLAGTGQSCDIITYNVLSKYNYDIETIDQTEEEKTNFTLHTYQEEAIENITKAFGSGVEKGKLIMACGTGKTFTSLKLIERLECRYVLFLVPSLSLIEQVKREFTKNKEKNQSQLVICSDKDITSQNDIDTLQYNEIDLLLANIKATTDPKNIYDWYKKVANNKNINIIFCTYHSLHRVKETYDKHSNLPIFDLILCDEAHNTASKQASNIDKENFTLVLDNSKVRRKHTLFMTATPRIYKNSSIVKVKEKQNEVLYSMDKKEYYGEVLYEYNFADAIKDGMLCDIEFCYLGMDMPPEARKDIYEPIFIENIDNKEVQSFIFDFMRKDTYTDEHGEQVKKDKLNKILCFTNTIANSEKFCDTINANKELDIEIRHVDGTTPTPKRNSDLDWLGQDGGKTVKMLTNARCLTEGVDVPDVNAVLFIEPKTSQIDIIQAIGRCIRKPKNSNKTKGYIIIPLIIPNHLNDYTMLLESAYYQIINILNAMKDMGVDMQTLLLSKVYNIKNDNDNSNDDSNSNGKNDDDGNSNDNNKNNDQPNQVNLPFEFEKLYIKFLKFKEVDTLVNFSLSLSHIIGLAQDFYEKNYDSNYAKETKTIIEASIHEELTEKGIKDIIIQHVLLIDILDILFEKSNITKNNPIAKVVDKAVDKIFGEDRETIQKEVLKEFDIIYLITKHKPEEKKHFLNKLFESFYKEYYPKESKAHGVVYTPVEMAGFIAKGTDFLIQKYFQKQLIDKDIHIIDPFAGTGTLLTELLSYMFSKYKDNQDAITNLYTNNIHYNEINLLAYYMSNLFIENIYFQKTNHYTPFNNGVFCDTLEQIGFVSNPYHKEIDEKEKKQTYINEGYTKTNENFERMEKQNENHLTIIIANPPYRAQQKISNEDNKQKDYPTIVKRVTDTYGSSQSYQDAYVKSLRWMSDRITKEKSIIAIIIPTSFLKTPSFQGMRQYLMKEFNAIYIIDGSGEKRKSFFKDSRQQTCIVFLIKLNNKLDETDIKIYYKHLLGQVESKDKLQYVNTYNIDTVDFVQQEHNYAHGHLLTQDKTDFYDNIFILPKLKTRDKNNQPEYAIFENSRQSVVTARDYWVYDFDKSVLENKIKHFIEIYNDSIHKNNQDERLTWNEDLTKYFKNKKICSYGLHKILQTIYYPFTNRYLYYDYDAIVVDRPIKYREVFGQKFDQNNIILYSGFLQKGICLAINKIPGIWFSHSYITPLYLYDKNDKRKDNITDDALRYFQSNYDKVDISKEQIFAYIYAVYHAKYYQDAYTKDIVDNQETPSIPLFREFNLLADIGKKLINYHVNFAQVSKHKDVTVHKRDFKGNINPILKTDKQNNCVTLDAYTTITNIPEMAFEYKVSMATRVPISPIESLLYYQVPKPPKNIREANQEVFDKFNTDEQVNITYTNIQRKYLMDVIPRLATVGVETVKLIREINRHVNETSKIKPKPFEKSTPFFNNIM